MQQKKSHAKNKKLSKSSKKVQKTKTLISFY
jgi:hypothetical protein